MNKILLAIMISLSLALIGCDVAKKANDTVKTTSEPTLESFKENNKYGYKANGKIVIPAQYDGADEFREGLAFVSKNEKWGFINQQGEVVIPLQYDWYILSF